MLYILRTTMAALVMSALSLICLGQEPFWVTSVIPTGGPVMSVAANREGHIFAAIQGDGLWKSMDEGQSWSHVPLWEQWKIANSVAHVMFDDHNRGYISADGGVYRSLDGGRTWEMHPHGIPGRSGALTVKGAGPLVYAWVDRSWNLSYSGAICASTDNGATWSIKLNKAHPFELHVCPSTGTIIARSAATIDSLMRSTDGGETWTANRYPLDSAMLAPFASDSTGLLYAIGHDRRTAGRLARSRDDGITWEWLPLDLNRDIDDILVNKLGHIYLAVNDAEGVWVSKDGGSSAEKLWRGMDIHIAICLALMPDGRIIAGGKHRVYISVRSTTETESTSAAVPAALSIEAAYPQPARNDLSVRIAVPGRGEVRNTLTDMLGRTVRHIREDVHTAGTRSVLFETEDLPSGPYLLTVVMNGALVRRTVLVAR